MLPLRRLRCQHLTGTGGSSSPEHAPLALAEAGVKVVIAEAYARIFFRNAVNGGYVVPAETPTPLIGKVHTGDAFLYAKQAGRMR